MTSRPHISRGRPRLLALLLAVALVGLSCAKRHDSFQPGPVPGTPTNLSAAPMSASEIDLTWHDNSSDEEGFRIESATLSSPEQDPNNAGWTTLATVAANDTTYHHTGLAPSSTHAYRVVAFHALGESDYSNTAEAVTPTSGGTPAPAAPTGLTATTVSSTRIDLSWRDNSSNEDGFRVERMTGASGTWTEVASVGAGSTSWTDDGRTPATLYSYRVRAHGDGGFSGYSNTATATTLPTAPTVPAAPTNLTASAASSSQINLSWQDNSNNEDGFHIERATGSSGSFSEIATVGPGVTSYTSSGLSASTLYRYRVRAHGTAGYSDYSNIASATTQSGTPSAPSPPSNLSANAVSTSQINLSWQDNANNEDGFRIERATGSGGGGFNEIATVGPGSQSYQDTGLSPSTTYRYRVRAHNAGGFSSYSNTATATTQDAAPSPPVAPSNMRATATSPTDVDVTWKDNSNNEDSYHLERADNAGGFVEIAVLGAHVVSYHDSGLTPMTLYSYRVRAHGAGGYSSYSNVDTALTPAPPPQPPDMSGAVVSDSAITLTWTFNWSAPVVPGQGYGLEESTASASAGFGLIQYLIGRDSPESYTVVRSAGTYYYRVRALLDLNGGASPYSNVVSATVASAPPPGPEPARTGISPALPGEIATP
jgi:titin